MVAQRLPGPRLRVLAMAALCVLLLAACSAPATPAGSSASPSAGPAASTSPSSSPSPAYAGSFAGLGFSLELPDGWVFGTERDVANAIESLRAIDPEWAARLDVVLAESATPTSAFVAYNVASDDEITPGLSCNTLERGSMSIDEALDLSEAQNLAGIAQLPGIVGSPVADRTVLPVGPTVRIRWQGRYPSAGPSADADTGSIGYAFVSGPTIYACVFTAGASSVARHEPEWEAILRTFRADPAWYVAATFPVGVKPFLITSGFGALWVANTESGTVSRIRPADNEIVATIDLRAGRDHGANEGPFGITAGDDRIWVTSMVMADNGEPLDGIVWAIDPSTNRATVIAEVGRAPVAIAGGFGSFWVANLADGTVSRLDPTTGVVAATIQVGTSPNAIATGGGSVWVGDAAAGRLLRIDPATNRVTDTIDLSGNATGAIVAGEGGIWVATEPALELVDPLTNTVVATVELPGIAGLASDAGSILAAEGMGVRVLALDEHAAEVVEEVAIGTNSWGITVLDGVVWVVQPAAADRKWAESAPGMVTRIER